MAHTLRSASVAFSRMPLSAGMMPLAKPVSPAIPNAVMIDSSEDEDREEVGLGVEVQHVGQEPRQSHPGQRAQQRHHDRLPDQQQEHVAVGKPDRLEDAHLTGPFAGAHHHGVGRDQEHGEHHGAADRTQQQLEVAQHAHELEIERFLRHGPRFVGAVGETGVDGRGDGRGSLRVHNGQHVHADKSLAELPGLVEPLEVEVHHRLVERGRVGRVDRTHVELPQGRAVLLRPDRAAQHQPVADLFVKPLGDLCAEHAAHLVGHQRLDFFRRDFDLGIQRQVAADVGGELGEELLLLLAVRPGLLREGSEPIGRRNALDPLGLLNQRAVRHGQLEDDRFLVHHHQARGVRHVHARVEGVEHRFQEAEQEQCDAHAKHRERGAERLAHEVEKQ
jgi:hypothetical protein